MLRIRSVLWVTALGVSSQPVPSAGPQAPAQASVDRAFAHALSSARTLVDKLDPRFEHSTWEDPWVIPSEHYEVRTTASRAYGVRMSATLEAMLPIYGQLFDTDKLPRGRVPVLIHPTQEAYSQFGDDHSDERSSIWGGFFDPNNPGGAIATVYDPNEALERMYLVRSSCQQFVHYAFNGRSLPTPLAQGLGAYAETFWVWDFLLTRFEELRDSNQLIPLPELLSAERSAYVTRPEVFNVQLAVLTTYLRNFREDTSSEMDGARLLEAGPFDQYVRKIVRGKRVADDPVHKLLTEEGEALDAEIRAFRGWRD